MKAFKGGEHVIEAIKEPSTDVLDTFKNTSKPADLTDEEKKSEVDVGIKNEKIKEYVKNRNLIKSNLKKIYSLIYENCTEGV